jgi:hypothetical protein
MVKIRSWKRVDQQEYSKLVAHGLIFAAANVGSSPSPATKTKALEKSEAFVIL